MQFDSYAGEQSGKTVSALIGRLIANSYSFGEESEKVPNVTFDNTTISYSNLTDKDIYVESLASFKQNISLDSFYNVSLQYDKVTGLISEIIIKEK